MKPENFSLQATSGETITPDSLKGRYSVIYFYPKDNTPGCTTEAGDFRDYFETFKNLGVQIFGVSRDSIKKHENFKTKLDLPFELISDPDEVLCKQFDVIKLKKLYGKEYLGIDRSTFVINGQGEIEKEWRSVKVKGHAAAVLEYLKNR